MPLISSLNDTCIYRSRKTGITRYLGEWRRGTSPLRSLRTGLEPLGSSGSHYPAFVNGFTFFTGSSHKMVDL
jgi:hypothetical protein